METATGAILQTKQKDIINRLRTIRGHIAGIEKMVDEGKCCAEVLAQVLAARASIHKVGLLLMENDIHACLTEPDENGNIDMERIETLFRTLMGYLK